MKSKIYAEAIYSLSGRAVSVTKATGSIDSLPVQTGSLLLSNFDNYLSLI